MRKFAKDNGVNINEVTATGPKGTVTKEDVENFMKPAPTPVAAPVIQQQAAPAAQPVKGIHLFYLRTRWLIFFAFFGVFFLACS